MESKKDRDEEFKWKTCCQSVCVCVCVWFDVMEKRLNRKCSRGKLQHTVRRPITAVTARKQVLVDGNNRLLLDLPFLSLCGVPCLTLSKAVVVHSWENSLFQGLHTPLLYYKCILSFILPDVNYGTNNKYVKTCPDFVGFFFVYCLSRLKMLTL